jgi:hypothetical protein
MIRIAEKLGLIKVRTVTVCAKVGIGRKAGHKSYVFLPIFNKAASKTKIFDSSR